MPEDIIKNISTKNAKMIWTVAIIVMVIIVIAILNPLVIVNAGERGVVLNWGAVSDTILDEGIHLRVPVMQKVVKMDVKIQKEERGASASSKDLQIVTSKVAINYHLDTQKVNQLWQEVGYDYSNRIISPAIEEFVKKTTAYYTAEELITKREDIKNDLKLAITENLAKNNILVDDIFITSFDFSDGFNKAIEAKVTAEQNALKAKNDLERVKMEAEQKITRAKADAESIRIQAQAITQRGGKDYVQLQAIGKWDGKLPTSMIPAGSVPFLDVQY
ncbi:prohibitin family protein [Candidatus Falkowbacteria bacterium]|jgi:regulator of protease activity HflC (stomatin/prohibitin superfamily)|nr:prohibitin family protein [Candidatus Falkowbacteria bacterium]MBT7007795.1 prohibitin family protein [Candidatus Falkowbacteria bacterium]